MVVVGAGTDPSPLISHKKKIRLKALRLSALKKKTRVQQKKRGERLASDREQQHKKGGGM